MMAYTGSLADSIDVPLVMWLGTAELLTAWFKATNMALFENMYIG